MAPHAPARQLTISRRAFERLGLGAALMAALGPGGALAESATPGASAADLVASNTAFALALYEQARAVGSGNLIVSPYSISQALAMVYDGARGATAAQMAHALAFGMEPPALDQAFAALNRDLTARGNAKANTQTGQAARGLRLANALWGERTYPFSSSYMDELARAYGAGLQTVDFAQAPGGARGKINDWVAKQTNDRIQDIVPPGAITAMTRLVLANAIWFSGPWANPFDPEQTQDGPFHRLDGAAATVPFMVQRAHLDYGSGDGFRAIEFPFAGSGFVFTVILPDAGTFDAFEASLNPQVLADAIDQLADTEVLVYLPKFKFEFGAVDLVPMLRAMGITDAFDPKTADFTGMMEGTPPEPLYVSDVLHKAFVSVDEKGVEAAAATVVGMTAGAMPGPETEPPEVRIDRPFLFAIRDGQTGSLLFWGRVLDPSA
jgi:serpin B